MSADTERRCASADEIAYALTRPQGPFPYRRYVCVPNVSWGLDLAGEADVVALSGSGYLTEIEIKISVADFRRDAGKRKHRLPNGSAHGLVSAFYYAMPDTIWPKIEAEFPPHAGLILVDDEYRARVVIKAPARACRKLRDDEREQLGRLGTMRYWTRLNHGQWTARPAEQRERE